MGTLDEHSRLSAAAEWEFEVHIALVQTTERVQQLGEMYIG